jgi:hypothetical protein
VRRRANLKEWNCRERRGENLWRRRLKVGREGGEEGERGSRRPGGAGEKEVAVRGPVVGIEMRLPHRA